MGQWFNPDAFVNPPNYTFGNVPRTLNRLRGPGAVNLDASLTKTVTFRKRYYLQMRFEAFNVANTPPLGSPGASFGANLNQTANTNVNFGMITTAGSPRVFQLGAKLNY